MRRRVLLALRGCIAAAALVNCRQQPAPADRIPDDIGIAVVGTKSVFDGNLEVRLAFDNRSQSDFILSGLGSQQVYLDSATGTRRALHPLSVGVAKPLTVPAHSQKQISVLFSAGTDDTKQIVIKDRKLHLP